MRFVAALLFWLVTTVLLAAAVPAMWAQRNVVSEDGYAALGRDGRARIRDCRGRWRPS